MNPRISLRAMGAAAAAVVVAIAAAGCGSTEPAATTTSTAPATTRAATADSRCPERRGSEASYFTFMNDLDTDVTLRVPRASWSCSGYSGVSTPGNLDGRVIGHPGPQPRIRMERYLSNSIFDTKFTLSFMSGSAALATVEVSSFTYPGPMYPWGIRVGRQYTCYRPVVELKRADGTAAGYLTMTNRCAANASGDVVFHLTKIEPWK